MADDLLPGDPPPPPPAGRGSRLTCDFCGCSLAPSGDVLRMSDAAKKFRDANDVIAALEKKVTQLQAAADDLKTQLQVATDKSRDRSLHLG